MTNRAAIPNPALQPLAVLIGDWHTTGKHPAVPGKTLHGKASFEWIEGGAFLLMHSQLDDDRFPDGIAIVGSDGAHGSSFMLYFDERGVSRKYDFAFGDKVWSWRRQAKDISQRFECTITDGGRTMVGRGEMSKDGGPWENQNVSVLSRRGLPVVFDEHGSRRSLNVLDGGDAALSARQRKYGTGS